MKSVLALLALGAATTAAAVVHLPAQELQEAATPQPQFEIPAEFRHASEFVRLLEQSGVTVQEVLRSRMEATFAGVRSAAFVRTSRGVAEIVVLPGVADAEQISITYTRNSSSVVPHHYALKGPPVRSQSQPMDVAYPLYFTLHRNWFIMTLEPFLDDVLKRALKQTNRPDVQGAYSRGAG